MSVSKYKKWMTESFLYEDKDVMDQDIETKDGKKVKVKTAYDNPDHELHKKAKAMVDKANGGDDKEKKKPVSIDIDAGGGIGGDDEPKDKGDEEDRFGIPNQDLKDTILQDLNPPRDAERDELGLPTTEEEWDKEMTEVESLYKNARDYYEDVQRKAADSAFGDDEEEAEYYADKEAEAEKEFNKYKAVRDAYEEKGQELGVYARSESITFNGKKYKAIKESKHPIKEQYDRLFTNRVIL